MVNAVIRSGFSGRGLSRTLRLVVIRGVAVEKLAHFDFAKTVSLQEALQAIFPSLLDIFYTRFSTFFGGTDFFNSHRISQHLSIFRRKSTEDVPIGQIL